MAGEGRDFYAIFAGALRHDGNLGGDLGDTGLVAGVKAAPCSAGQLREKNREM